MRFNGIKWDKMHPPNQHSGKQSFDPLFRRVYVDLGEGNELSFDFMGFNRDMLWYICNLGLSENWVFTPMSHFFRGHDDYSVEPMQFPAWISLKPTH